MATKTVQMQCPSVGRIVHYIAYGTPGGEFPAGEKRAAIVTQVHETRNPESDIGLCVVNPNGFYFNERVSFGSAPGQWCWPDYVAPVTVEVADEDV